MRAVNPESIASARCEYFLTAEALLKYLLGTSGRIR